jgi:membrane protease YdiL (CAAX protease family)
LVAGLALLVLRSVWCALQAGAAAGEWARVAPGRLLLGPQGPRPWRRLAAALALGAALGAVSAPLFHFLGVESGPDLERLAQAFPGLAAQPPLVRTLLAVSVGCAAAVTEEITFRGALLGFFLALAGQRWWGPALAGLLTAGIWASMHLGMTTAPLLKAGQITVLGLLLAEVARRRGLGAAVAIHLGVNLTGAIMAPLVLPLSAP